MIEKLDSCAAALWQAAVGAFYREEDGSWLRPECKEAAHSIITGNRVSSLVVYC